MTILYQFIYNSFHLLHLLYHTLAGFEKCVILKIGQFIFKKKGFFDMTTCTVSWGRKFDKNKKYIWISEMGENTCEECKMLDGKIFSGDKVPQKPHPNCKCEVNECSANKSKTENTEILDLKQEAEALQRKVTVLNAKIIQTEAIDIEENYDEELEKIIEDLTKVKQKTEVLENSKINIPNIAIINEIISNIKEKIQKLEYIIVKKSNKKMFDLEIKAESIIFNHPDAASLWDISSSKFQSKSAQNYIMLNGQIVEKVSDLNDRHLEKFIKNKLYEQLQINEAKGIFFNNDSSLAKAIIQDNKFQEKIKEIVKGNKNKLIFKRIADDTSFGSFSSKDLRNALGNVDIIDIYIDNKYNLCALIIDTYDFNKNENNSLVQKGREYQELNEIENYYLIIPIKIPLKKRKTF